MQKDKDHMASLMWEFKKVDFTDVQSRIIDTRLSGEWECGERLISGY